MSSLCGRLNCFVSWFRWRGGATSRIVQNCMCQAFDYAGALSYYLALCIRTVLFMLPRGSELWLDHIIMIWKPHRSE